MNKYLLVLAIIQIKRENKNNVSLILEIKRRSANFPTLILHSGTAKHLNSGQVRKSPRPSRGHELTTCLFSYVWNWPFRVKRTRAVCSSYDIFVKRLSLTYVISNWIIFFTLVKWLRSWRTVLLWFFCFLSVSYILYYNVTLNVHILVPQNYNINM